MTTITRTRSVRVDIGGRWLVGDLAIPPRAYGLVLFAHGSGSGRLSPRNQHVARTLDDRGLATLLIDLLTEQEELIDRRTAHLRFDIDLLADRLTAVADWIHGDEEVSPLPIGLFGASTGAAAALITAARRPRLVAAVVSRGGRPDLAGPALAEVVAPTLLIVGERDTAVIGLNEEAMARMHTEVRLEIVPGATHLFEEPGALDRVARLAGDWFETHLRNVRRSP
jgi:putative phosphoribosyl transferase